MPSNVSRPIAPVRIAAGVDPYRLAKWAGHRDVSTIDRVYRHLLDLEAEAEREALTKMREAARSRSAGGTVHAIGG